ncbi:MAG: hypothetical protein MUF15_26660 [Acidobacteria bacterium]|jgi:hypothetical protein|nr:hypothetical protein [Acidobacteriota bacterium]
MGELNSPLLVFKNLTLDYSDKNPILHLVSEEFQKYHRENIESGRVFEDKQFGDLKNRAGEG